MGIQTIESIIKDLRRQSEILVREPVSYSWAKEFKDASQLLEAIFTSVDKTIDYYHSLDEYYEIKSWMMDTKGKGLLLLGSCGRGKSVIASGVIPVLFRMKGMYFAIATWIAAEAAQKIFLDWKYVGQGAGMTIRIVPYPDIFRLYVLSLVLCVAVLLLLSAILRSRLGLGLMAMRDNPPAASTIGINLFRIRFLVYEISAVRAALTGAVFFINKGVIYPESGFSITWTVSAVFICIIGGTGTVMGPVIGAVIYVLLQEFLAHYPGWSNIMLGLITILVIRFMPGGIARQLDKLKKAVLRRPRKEN